MSYIILTLLFLKCSKFYIGFGGIRTLHVCGFCYMVFSFYVLMVILQGLFWN